MYITNFFFIAVVVAYLFAIIHSPIKFIISIHEFIVCDDLSGTNINMKVLSYYKYILYIYVCYVMCMGNKSCVG